MENKNLESSTNKTDIKKFERSPNFPILNLSDALKKARELYDHDGTTYVPLDLIHERWGFKKMSGYLNQIIATMKSYGLINVDGQTVNRKIKISVHGLKILLNSDNKEELIKKSALLPMVFQEIWEAYKGNILPQDDVLNRDLILGELFSFKFINDRSRKLLIKNFKETLNFAKLDPTAIIENKIEDPQENIEEMISTQHLNKTPKPDLLTKKSDIKNYDFSLPLSEGGTASVKIPYSMNSTEFEIMTKVIEALKDALFSGKNQSTEKNKD